MCTSWRQLNWHAGYRFHAGSPRRRYRAGTHPTRANTARCAYMLRSCRGRANTRGYPHESGSVLRTAFSVRPPAQAGGTTSPVVRRNNGSTRSRQRYIACWIRPTVCPRLIAALKGFLKRAVTKYLVSVIWRLVFALHNSSEVWGCGHSRLERRIGQCLLDSCLVPCSCAPIDALAGTRSRFARLRLQIAKAGKSGQTYHTLALNKRSRFTIKIECRS